ncbi:pyridoxal-phosphate-dependent aminotransferase family protein [Heyndrickxia acidiproducens]|uniref:pyridoxal-phosphate-dependent aminotransferase family protein n=1 Tax=Heyndrickxia acidiproducens TaxID=1121084 RepID=UPI00036A243D|nr:alanine--glyoxylate aminotransferase family protein [Heyndrickxia acidiproducens]
MLFCKESLFTPGPTPVPDRVKQAMNQPMVAHRSQVFSKSLQQVATRLMPVFGSKEPVIVIAGSGTSALESAVCNTVHDGDHVVVVVTGVFGERFASICETYGSIVHRLDIEWGKACRPEQLETFLKELDHPVQAVFATYCETSTSVLNPVKELGAVVKRLTDALYIVDGVSCIGGVPVDMEDYKIDILVSGSQKALMLPPGLAFVAVNKHAKDAIKSGPAKRFYLDLNRYIQSYEEGTTTPFTPPVSLVYGANEVCQMIEEEGFDQVIKRHEVLKNMARAGIKALELPLLVEKDEDASPTVTAVKPAEGKADSYKKYMQEHFAMTLASGQKRLKGEIFRVGHMGYSTPFDVLNFLSALEIAAHDLEGKDTFGKAVKKAEEVWKAYV